MVYTKPEEKIPITPNRRAKGILLTLLGSPLCTESTFTSDWSVENVSSLVRLAYWVFLFRIDYLAITDICVGTFLAKC